MTRAQVKTSEIMARVKSENTSPELAFRRALFCKGVRYRLHGKKLPGKPDLVVASKRLAIFIDGDFWHGRQWKSRGHASLNAQLTGVNNQSYWLRKIGGNIRRDFLNTQALLDAGWRVLRFWESDIRERLAQCVEITMDAIEDGTAMPAGAEVAQRTVCEFFAGIGLVRLALESRGWNVVFANDNDSQKFETYRANFGDDHFDLRNIHDIPGSEVPSCALITGSFPCNDLSVAGSMRGIHDGEHSSAFWGLIRILNEMGDRKPPMVLLENVPGFLRSHEGRDLEAALLALNSLGYACDVFQLDAADFVPQSRPRLFVVGKLTDSSGVAWGVQESAVRPKTLVEFIHGHSDIRWDIQPLPAPPEREVALETILEDLPWEDATWWNEKRTSYFMSQLSERHAATAQSMIEGSEYSYATAFRRVRKGKSMAELRTDGVAGCLRTPRGGSGRQILFKAGKGEHGVRLLTARECARLQGAPEEYQAPANLSRALFGFGDAVCVPVIQWIADHYLVPVASERLRGQLLVPAR